MYGIFKNHWVAAAGFMSVALLALVPLLARAWPMSLLLVLLASPAYMLHQVEEHTGDRFRIFVNTRMFGGREALTTFDVLWVNVGAVWGLNLAALYVAAWVSPGWSLVAPYLMLVNALGHIAGGFRFHGYNPGLMTACLVFIPLGLATVREIPASALQQAAGVGLAVGLHILIAAVAIARSGSKTLYKATS